MMTGFQIEQLKFHERVVIRKVLIDFLKREPEQNDYNSIVKYSVPHDDMAADITYNLEHLGRLHYSVEYKEHSIYMNIQFQPVINKQIINKYVNNK